MVVPAGLQHEARGGGFRRFVGSGLVRLVIVGVVIGGGALWGAIQAANRDESGQIVGAGDVDAFDLQVGDCLAEPEGTEIASVRGLPCSEPHDIEVIHNATLTGSTAPTETELGPLISQHCLPAFETYVGIPYGDHPTLYVDVLWPSPESWAEGDRVLTCFVFDAAGALTASVRAN